MTNFRLGDRVFHQKKGYGRVDSKLFSNGVGRAQERWVKWDDGSRTKVRDSGLVREREAESEAEASREEPSGVVFDGDTLIITPPAGTELPPDMIDALIRENGLDPEDWLVVNSRLNKWNAMTSDKATGDNRIVWMQQRKVTLKKKPHLILVSPATHVPEVRRTPRAHPLNRAQRPELIVIEGDHQVPYHDEELHQASLNALADMYHYHNLTEQVFLGDSLDFSNISKHADHPAAMATVNECIQAGYDVLRDKVEAAPMVRRRKLKGNHDWRLEGELLLRAERLYGIRPASIDGREELPALSLRRLLHLDALGIELVESPLGWEHGEIELVPGPRGLVVRHGWITGQNTADKTLAKRGRSIIVGHKHNRDHVFKWDPGVETERQAVVNGVMCLVRSDRFPHFAPCDDWSQGFVTVTRWPDGEFNVEHARWDGRALRWRDRAWTA